MNTLTISLLTASIALYGVAASAVTISPQNDGAALANALAGPGISIDPSSIGYTGVAGQAGTFSGGLAPGGTGIGIDSGIILTTGLASSAPGPNTFPATSSETGSGGDEDLADLYGGPIFDANVLAFDFTSGGGDFSFNYVFASEEYEEYVFLDPNDVFALFLDGENIALIGNQLVGINTVNCGPSGVGTGVNCDRFNDNTTGVFNVEYDGLTDVLTASVNDLAPGRHSMKIAIGDRFDALFDSVVFIEANSFTVESPAPSPVPEPGSLALLGLGLVGLGFARRRSV